MGWADEEDEDWHEDTWEWKDKMRQEKTSSMPMPGDEGFDAQKFMSMHQEQQQQGMQMSFVAIKPENNDRKDKANELAERWSTLLKTDGIDVKPYVLDPAQILFTQDDGRFTEYKEFIL